MIDGQANRREFLRGAGQVAGAVAACCLGTVAQGDESTPANDWGRGAQRLSLQRLKHYESLGYGMFISYGVQPFIDGCIHSGKTKRHDVPASAYAPDKLDVGQWISVARDAGMKYAVLTAKRHPGFCLWPSQHTDYTVANSGNKTDVVEAFVKACEQRGIEPGLYYPSVDIHHCFGRPLKDDWKYTTSLYQTFQTNQITELLSGYGPIAEVWVDIPRVLGRGYRTFLYEHIARLQPNAVIMMNLGLQDGTAVAKSVDKFWPSDLISIERRLPPESGHQPWRTIEGKPYYLPAEVSDSIKPTWYWVNGEKPRADEEVLAQFQACRRRGVNLLLDAPPDNHGLIPPPTVDALMRLRRNAGI